MSVFLQTTQEFYQVCLGRSVWRSIHQPQVISELSPVTLQSWNRGKTLPLSGRIWGNLNGRANQRNPKRSIPIYYVSKAFHDSELNYSRIEKLTYSLLMASRKLRQYFQSHHVTVLTDQPLKEVLQRMTTSGRMIKWSIELSEYDMKFWPRKSNRRLCSRVHFSEASKDRTSIGTSG